MLWASNAAFKKQMAWKLPTIVNPITGTKA
jgi:hypothetical protein